MQIIPRRQVMAFAIGLEQFEQDSGRAFGGYRTTWRTLSRFDF